MAEIKRLSTELQVKDKLLDTSGDAGTSGQILSSTGTGTNWINAGTFSGGTVANASTFSSAVTFNGDIIANTHIYGRYVNNSYSKLYRFGGLYLTWDSDSYGTAFEHSLTSSYGGTFNDSITLNSYNHIRFNIDSNNNNSTSYFEVGDGTTGTSNVIFRIDQAGDVTITGDSTTSGDFTIADNKALMLGTGGDAFFKHTGSAFSFFNDTGHVTFTQRVTDGNIIFKSDNMLGGETEYFRLDGAAGETIFSRNTQHLDGVYAQFGTGDDLKIMHESDHSRIYNETGDLIIRNNADNARIRFQCDNGSGGYTSYFDLQGSQANGTRVYTNWYDNSVITLGNGLDTQLYHDGTNTHFYHQTGDLYFKQATDNKDIIFQCDDSSGGLTDYYRIDGANHANRFYKNLALTDNTAVYWGNSNDFYIKHNATNTEVINSTGHLYIDNYANDSDIYFRSDDGSGGIAEYFRVDGGATKVIANKNFAFVDSVKAEFGDSGDLQIYHDGSNSYIDETGTGSLYIKSAGAIRLQSDTGENMIYAVNDGAVNLYHNNVKTFETTATGATVTGNLSVTGDLNITGDINSVSVTDLDVVDKTITLGKGQTEANSSGSGIIVDGASASILWDESNSLFDFNKNINIETGSIALGGDVSLFRDGVNILRTDDAFHANGHIHVGGASGGGNIYNRSDTGNYIAFSSNAIAFSKNATFTGKINAKGGASVTGFTAATINAYTATVSSNLYSALRIVDNTAASTYWDIGAVGGASPDLKFFVNASTSAKFTLSTAGNADFAGTISTTGIASTLRDSVLISYSGNDGNGNDAGLKIMNDGNDWGAYIRKSSNGNYGLRIDSGGNNALSIYSTTGGSTKTFGVNGSNGDTTVGGALSVAGTLSPAAVQVTGDNAFYRHYILSATGGESWNASNGWHRIIEITGGSGRGRCRFLIQTNGGSGTPCRVEGIVNTAWSNSNATLSIIHNSYPNFITDIRVVRNSTSGKSFVDIKGTGEDYVEVTILPDGVVQADVVNFTNVNTLPSGDTMEIHQTLTNMIMSLSSGQGSGNGWDGTAGTGQRPFQVKYDGSIYAEQGHFEDEVYISGYINHTGDSGTAIGFDANDVIRLKTASSTAMQIDSSQNVKVVAGKLQISGDNDHFVELVQSGNGDFTIDAPDDLRLDAGGGDVVLKKAGTEYARLTHNNPGLHITTSETNASIYLTPNGTGNVYASTDTFIVSATEGETAKILLRTDESDDNGDDWYITNETNNNLEFTNDRTGSQLANLTLTPQGPSNSAAANFAGNVTVTNNLTVGGADNSFDTGNNGTFVTKDTNNYPRITVQSASAQLGLFRSNNNVGGMYIGGASDGFRIWTEGFSPKFHLDQSGNADFSGNVILNSRLTFDYGGDHYIEAGTNSLAFKNSSGGSTLVLGFADQAATFYGTVAIPSYIYHKDDPSDDTYFGFSGNDTFVVYTAAGKGIEIDSNRNVDFTGDITISNATPAINLTDTDNSSNIALSSVGGALIVNSTSDQVYQIGGSEYFRLATSLGTFATNLQSNGTSIKVTNSGNAVFYASSTGSGYTGIYLDASNGDFSGSDYFSIRQLNDLSVEFDVRANAGVTVFKSKGSTNLTMDGTTSTFAGKVSLALANKGAPSYTFTGDTNTGMYSDSADSIKFTAGGNDRLLINLTSGKVDVVGSLTVSSDIEDRNIPCIINTGWGDDSSTTSSLLVPLGNTVDDVSIGAKDGEHTFVAPYAGRLVKIIMKNTNGALSSSFTTELKYYVNGSVSALSGELTASSDAITWTPTSNNTFAAGDEINIFYQKSAGSKYWREVSMTIVIELTDYDI